MRLFYPADVYNFYGLPGCQGLQIISVRQISNWIDSHVGAETKWLPFFRRHFSTYFLEWKYMNFDQNWDRDKMAAVLQTTFLNIFSWMKIYEFRSKFHWNLFLRVQLTIFRHWHRWWLCTDQATCHYLNQWWLDYRRIYASLVITVKCHGLYPQSGKTPYRQIAWSLQAVRLDIMMIVSPWILTNISAVLLSRFLSFFRSIKKV